jgi:hypothetical protein
MNKPKEEKAMIHRPAHDFAVQEISSFVTNEPDDLFIACNSFEERCLGVATGLAPNFRTRFSCIFRYEQNADEAQEFEQDRKVNFQRITETLKGKTADLTFPIYCNRQEVWDGIGQFQQLYESFLKDQNCKKITIDITCFTKLYLFELLYFFVETVGIRNIRMAYNQPLSYGVAKLTKGIKTVSFMPHFSGEFLPNRETVLVAFLGFETERALGIWEHYEPFKTIVVVAAPPLKKEYVRKAEESNEFLMSRPGILRADVNPYDPYEVAKALTNIYDEHCLDSAKQPYNVGVISLGTKVQALGLFLFWCSHRKVRITYAFPRSYGEGYHSRRIGQNFVFPMKF